MVLLNLNTTSDLSILIHGVMSLPDATSYMYDQMPKQGTIDLYINSCQLYIFLAKVFRNLGRLNYFNRRLFGVAC